MKKQTMLRLLPTAVLFLLFAVYTVLVAFVDVRAIGPNGSSVGFGGLNGAFSKYVGVSFACYNVTDLLGLIPLLLLAAFGMQGLWQLIRRKSLLRVDRDLLILGGYYLAVFIFYAFFEVVAINARPILIDGVLETSYPSSTTMLAMATLPAVAMHLYPKLSAKPLCIALLAGTSVLTAVMVIMRVIAGVHWITDIIGGALLSLALLAAYAAARKMLLVKREEGEK